MDTLPSTLPIASIVCSVVSVLVAIGFPVFLFFFFRKKLDGKVRPVVVGALIFVVFSLVLEQISHFIFLYADWDVSKYVSSHALPFALYASFAAGIFEEFGRLFGYKILLKKDRSSSTPIMYAIGHGGIEAIILGGLSQLSSLFTAITLRSKGLEGFLAQYDSSTADSLRTNLTTFYTTNSFLFLITGIERIFAIGIHVALSVFVYQSVVHREKRYLFPVAILAHAAIDFLAALYQFGTISNVILVEAYCFVGALILLYFAIKLWKKDRINEECPN